MRPEGRRPRLGQQNYLESQRDGDSNRAMVRGHPKRAPRRAARALALLALAAAVGAAPARSEDAAPRTLRLRWLGVAGFSLEADGAVLLHDPYLSRPSGGTLLLRRYRPDEPRLARLLGPGGAAPELARAAWGLVGHSHFDHLGDVAWIAGHSGAQVLGSATTGNIARGYGLPEERFRRLEPGERISAGPFEVRAIASRHARVLLGRVPFDGEVTEPPPGPIHAASFKMGGARSYLVTHRASARALLTTSSADRDLAALEALRAEGVRIDVLLAATQGRDPGYARDLVRTLRPRVVVPHHFDDFLVPPESPGAGDPADPEDLDAFEREVAAAAAAEGVATLVRRPRLFEVLELSLTEP
jgi:L-ascorbate metabolism protein UlaG (beta-lactamase superfamily)